MLYRPQDVAAQLGVSSPTLRLWSSHFADDLSPYARKSAPSGQTAAQRRYTDDDVAKLLQIKLLLRQGLTFEQARGQLHEGRPEDQPASAVREQRSVQVLLTHPQNEYPQPQDSVPAEQLSAKDSTIAALREALVAREKALQALQDTVAAKDKTIDALKDSLQFFNAYLQAIGAMQSDGHRQETDQPRKWIELDAEGDQEMNSSAEPEKPRWRKLLGLP